MELRKEVTDIIEKYGWQIGYDNDGQVILYTGIFDPEKATDDMGEFYTTPLVKEPGWVDFAGQWHADLDIS